MPLSRRARRQPLVVSQDLVFAPVPGAAAQQPHSSRHQQPAPATGRYATLTTNTPDSHSILENRDSLSPALSSHRRGVSAWGYCDIMQVIYHTSLEQQQINGSAEFFHRSLWPPPTVVLGGCKPHFGRFPVNNITGCFWILRVFY